ncbi:hypothetical protein P8452_37554 [Trifolium repens]|nr:hypothetical protein P8452_37554 [Trifolium repens]
MRYSTLNPSNKFATDLNSKNKISLRRSVNNRAIAVPSNFDLGGGVYYTGLRIATHSTTTEPLNLSSNDSLSQSTNVMLKKKFGGKKMRLKKKFGGKKFG